jgi:transcriptional regulator with XRE-family HTH domain
MTRAVLAATVHGAVPVPDWAALVATLAEHVRTTRQRLGLSQEQLAMRAATSQGAISRLEEGGHVNVPLLSVVKILAALAADVAPIEDAVAPALRALLTVAADLGPTLLAGEQRAPDPDLVALLDAYHALPPTRRRPFVRVVLAACGLLTALGSTEDSCG